MALFDKMFGKSKSASRNEEAVLIYLDGSSLPDEVYASCDLSTLEDQLVEAIKTHRAGEFDGNEIGDKETVLYTYGPDARRLFEVMEPTLRTYPLCKNARVVIRQGKPGSPQTETRIQ
ncbi:MAG: hypothetical protein JST28_20540 [Acidobacteria bacterium]|nr:hypothetical protein [Acidobacteriota bacterium]